MPKSTKVSTASKDKRNAKVSKSAATGSKTAKASSQKSSAAVAPVEIAPTEILKRLASNDEETRVEALKTVSQKLKTPRAIEQFELYKLWKGLWFTMWHSDKPIVQQALAQDLSQLLSGVSQRNFWPFIDAFWYIAMREWETLDQHRINKFLLLARLMLNSTLSAVLSGSNDWPSRYASSMVEAGPLNYKDARYPVGLRLHIVDIYLDELEKVTESKGIPKLDVLKTILEPVLSQKEKSGFKSVRARVEAEVLTDERLIEWSIVEAKEEPAEQDSSDDDWEGFD